MSDPKVNKAVEDEAFDAAEEQPIPEERLLSEEDMVDYDAATLDDEHASEEVEEVVATDTAVAEELQKTKEQLLRALAELENTRKRAERDKEAARKFAVQDFAKDVVVVADNLQRALSAIPAEARAEDASQGLRNFITGVEMTDKALVDAFAKNGLEKVEPQPGDAFDYNFHQAMQQVDGTDYAPGAVAQVWQTGWMLNGRLLRPAMVAVAAGEPADKPSVDTEA